MAAKTFLDLKKALGDWLALNDTFGARSSAELPETIRGDAINMAIRELLRKHDTKYGQHTGTFQTVNEKADYVPFEGLLRPISLWYLNTSGNVVLLDFYDKAKFDQIYPITGIYGEPLEFGAGTFGQSGLGDPLVFTYWSGEIIVAPVPNRQIVLFCNGYRLLPDLVSDSDTNLMLTEAWEWVLFKALSLCVHFGIEDDRVTAWEKRAENLAMEICVDHKRATTIPKGQSISAEPGGLLPNLLSPQG